MPVEVKSLNTHKINAPQTLQELEGIIHTGEPEEVAWPPVIDLDTFDEEEYFPAYYNGHCIAIALALHQLTGWPLYSLHLLRQGHAVVLSPRGFFDLGGLQAKERFEHAVRAEHEEWICDKVEGELFLELTEPNCDWRSQPCEVTADSTEELRAEYLNRRDAGIILDRQEDSVFRKLAEKNLEMAIPVAEAILARYFPDGWSDLQEAVQPFLEEPQPRIQLPLWESLPEPDQLDLDFDPASPIAESELVLDPWQFWDLPPELPLWP